LEQERIAREELSEANQLEQEEDSKAKRLEPERTQEKDQLWRQSLTKPLPDELHVSNQLLSKLFLHKIDPQKSTALAVKVVEEDGHSLFRSLSQSQIFRSHYPDLSGN
jgi:hypothetical protein